MSAGVVLAGCHGTLIAKIAHEPAASFCISDAAPLYIAADRSDPTKFEADLWQSY